MGLEPAGPRARAGPVRGPAWARATFVREGINVSLSTIFSSDGAVLRRVPKTAGGAWAQCLARSLAAVADRNSLQAWVELCVLLKAVFRPPLRGGTHRRAQAISFTQRRCARWLEGERDELWEPPGRGGRSRGRRPRQPLMMKKVAQRQLADMPAASAWLPKAGLSRACASLVDPPLLDKNAEELGALRPRHLSAAPVRPGLLASGPCPVGAAPHRAVDDVAKAARSFHTGSAAGPTGLRGEHLREALDSAHGLKLLPTWSKWCNWWCVELAQRLTGATLHALLKGDCDVRPIAKRETLRRVAAKYLYAPIKSEGREWRAPLQIGDAAPLGVEMAIHSSRHWVHSRRSDPDKIFLKLDFTNAFNTVVRAALLRQMRLRLPAVVPWAEWCYNHRGDIRTSEAGMQ